MGIFMSKEGNLFEAVRAGKLADVIRYLQKGANVNTKDKEGLTPLSSAALWGHRTWPSC